MAQYSNIKKPAFYIPYMDYQQSLGNIEYKDDPFNDIHLLNPTKTHSLPLVAGEDIVYDVEFRDSLAIESLTDSDGYVYIFILGHNFHSIDASIEIELIEGGNYIGSTTRTEIVNDNHDINKPNYNGFSIFKAKYPATNVDGYRIRIRNIDDSTQTMKLGCVSLCSKWNPPHSPDLSVGMTREYDGVKTVTTKGGATLSNASYTRGGTFWATSYAWELTTGDYDQGTESTVEMQRTLGRRIWSMNFSYLKPENIMPKTESLNYYATSLESLSDTITQSQSFFSRVLNRVQGSHLPFIFQPNDTDPNYNPDQWAICRLDQKNVSITQAAPELYSLSMKLKESY